MLHQKAGRWSTKKSIRERIREADFFAVQSETHMILTTECIHAYRSNSSQYTPIGLFVIILHSAACGYGIYLTYFLPASSNNKNGSNVASPINPLTKETRQYAD